MLCGPKQQADEQQEQDEGKQQPRYRLPRE